MEETVMSKVLMTINNVSRAMCQVIAGNDTIVSTNNHKFYLPNFKKYLRADSLKAGMRVLTLAGTLAVINSVVAFDSTQQVYNFEVEEQHNYFVGEHGVLVHNDIWFCFFDYVGITPSMLGNFSDELRINLKNEILHNRVFRNWLEEVENVPTSLNARLIAWKQIEEGVPILRTIERSQYIPYMNRISTYILEKQLGSPDDIVTWYRVQGGTGTHQSWNLVNIDEASGNVSFRNENNLFNFSSKTIEHARYFQGRRPGSKIYAWDVPKWFDDFMKENAIPQVKYGDNPFNQSGKAPQISDPLQVGHAFTLKRLEDYWYPLLNENVIPGSGEIID